MPYVIPTSWELWVGLRISSIALILVLLTLCPGLNPQHHQNKICEYNKQQKQLSLTSYYLDTGIRGGYRNCIWTPLPTPFPLEHFLLPSTHPNPNDSPVLVSHLSLSIPGPSQKSWTLRNYKCDKTSLSLIIIIYYFHCRTYLKLHQNLKYL